MRDKNAVDVHGMVMVMGVTGSGKSAFVNLLKPVAERAEQRFPSDPKSPPQAVKLAFDRRPRRSITVIELETPGFNGTQPAGATALKEVLRYLSIQYALEIPLKGIIYFHSIDTPLTPQSAAYNYLEMFISVCNGPESLENVIFVTTGWDKIPEQDNMDAEEIGMQREQDLMDTWLGPILKRGATVMRFHGLSAEAQAMMIRLASNDEVLVLDVQKKLVDNGKSISDMQSNSRYRCFGNLASAKDKDEKIGQRAKVVVEQERRKLRHWFHRSAADIHVFLGILDMPCINGGQLTC